MWIAYTQKLQISVQRVQCYFCSFCMASEQHRGHIVEEITEFYKTKKEIFQNDATEIENRICPTYEIIIHDLKNQLANLDRNYEMIIKDIAKQGDELQREIVIVIDKMKTSINQMKEQHRDILQKRVGNYRITNWYKSKVNGLKRDSEIH